MRRPGFLGNTNYWFGDVRKPSLIANKLEEVRLAKIANGTPLSKGQVAQRLTDHLRDPRALSRRT
jgi:hypothetical protein